MSASSPSLNYTSGGKELILSTLPVDILREIVEWLNFYNLLGLWFCGCKRLNYLLSHGAIVSTGLTNEDRRITWQYPDVLGHWNGIRHFFISSYRTVFDPAAFWSHPHFYEQLLSLDLKIPNFYDLVAWRQQQAEKDDSATIWDLSSSFPNLTTLGWHFTGNPFTAAVSWPKKLLNLTFSSTYPFTLALPDSLTTLHISASCMDWSAPLPNIQQLRLLNLGNRAKFLKNLPPHLTDIKDTWISCKDIHLVPERFTGWALSIKGVKVTIPPTISYLIVEGSLAPESVQQCCRVRYLSLEDVPEAAQILKELSNVSTLKSVNIESCPSQPTAFPPNIVQLILLGLPSNTDWAAIFKILHCPVLETFECDWFSQEAALALSEVTSKSKRLLRLRLSTTMTTPDNYQNVISDLSCLPRSLTELDLMMLDKPRQANFGWSHRLLQGYPPNIVILSVALVCTQFSILQAFESIPQNVHTLAIELHPLKRGKKIKGYHGTIPLNALPPDLKSLILDIRGADYDLNRAELPPNITSLFLNESQKKILHRLPPSLQSLRTRVTRLELVGSIRAPRLTQLDIVSPEDYRSEDFEDHWLRFLPPSLSRFTIDGLSHPQWAKPLTQEENRVLRKRYLQASYDR